MKTDPLRLQALEILTEVFDGAPLDANLDQALNSLDDQRSRAFLAELVRGTLQWCGRYYHILNQFVTRKAPKENVELALFYLTMHQLLGLDGVPAYAAIHQAGELCRQKVGPGKVGFVNGVLQSMRRRFLPDDTPDPVRREKLMRECFENLNDDPVGKLAAWHSFPSWLVGRWVERYGLEKTTAFLEFNNQSVAMAFHVLAPHDPEQSRQKLTEAGLNLRAALTADDRCLVLEERPSRAVLGEVLEHHGELIVQDPSVQEATGWLLEAAGQLDDPALLELPVLDMCAAPGGKTARLAAAWPGASEIVAMDNRDHRVALLAQTAQRLNQPRTRVLKADGLNAPFEAGSFAAVLLDGPCSGTGVLRHHPDGRWQLSNRTPGRNGRILRKLAHAAVDLLAVGGVLLYATCSLEEQENERVLDKLLAERDDVEVLEDSQGRWCRQWLPGLLEDDSAGHAGDGFFAARLRKMRPKLKD